MLITHEDEVARHAKRVIRLVDGQVVSDVRQAPVDGPPPALRDPAAFAAQYAAQQSARPAAQHSALLGTAWGYAPVNPFEILRFAVGGLAANKVRSALTMLGVLIGVAAVIILLAVGNGSSQAVKDSIEKLGTNSLTVSSGGGFGASGSSGATSTKPLTVDDARALADPADAPDVESVAPEVTTSQTAVYNGTSHTVGQVVGTYPAYFKTSNSKVDKGDYFSDDDVLNSRKVAVIGSTTATDLFGTADPVGKKLVHRRHSVHGRRASWPPRAAPASRTRTTR